MASIRDVSAITEQIRARLEEQLKHHQNLGDGLERLRDALGRLEEEVRSRLTAGSPSRGAGSASASRTAPQGDAAPRSTSTPKRKPAASAKSPVARAPRGANKAKILTVLQSGPMTASEVAEQTGIPAASASTMLSKMAKAGELVKAERGYALPR